MSACRILSIRPDLCRKSCKKNSTPVVLADRLVTLWNEPRHQPDGAITGTDKCRTGWWRGNGAHGQSIGGSATGAFWLIDADNVVVVVAGAAVDLAVQLWWVFSPRSEGLWLHVLSICSGAGPHDGE